MQTLRVQMKDLWFHPKGIEPRNHSVVGKHCRQLLKDGYSKDTRLEIYRNSLQEQTEDPEPDIIVKNIGEAAKWTILENEKEGPKFIKYEPFPENMKKKKVHSV